MKRKKIPTWLLMKSSLSGRRARDLSWLWILSKRHLMKKKNSMYFVLFSRVEGSRNLSYPREGCVTINKMKLELCRKKSIATTNYYYKNSF